MQTIARLNDPSLFTDRCLVGGKWIAAETSSAIEVANRTRRSRLGRVLSVAGAGRPRPSARLCSNTGMTWFSNLRRISPC